MFCDVEISFLELNIIQKSENKYTVFFELSVSILSFAKKKKFAYIDKTHDQNCSNKKVVNYNNNPWRSFIQKWVAI